MMRFFICALTVFALMPLAAQAFTSRNKHKVAQIDNAVFEVVGRPGSGPREFWCAAGDYAYSRRAGGSTRIYLASGRTPSVSQPGRTAVRFTFSPEAAGITPIEPQLVLNVDTPGDNLRAVSAREYCALNISRF